MTKKLLFVTTLLLVVALGLWAADVTGKWTCEMQGRNGARTVTFDLKSSGASLTGTVSGMGREDAPPLDISDGKIDGNNISFSTKMEFNGNTRVTTFKGIVSGDSIKLDVTRPGRGGGAPTTSTVTAKKSGT